MKQLKTQSRILLELGDKPIVTFFYKGKFFFRSPVNDLNISYTLWSRKPKRKDKTYDVRMKKWQDLVKTRLLKLLTEQYQSGVYANHFNLDTKLEIKNEDNLGRFVNARGAK